MSTGGDGTEDAVVLTGEAADLYSFNRPERSLGLLAPADKCGDDHLLTEADEMWVVGGAKH